MSKTETSKVEVEIGDVVVMNSGGPRMTVMGLRGDSFVVSYFLPDSEYKTIGVAAEAVHVIKGNTRAMASQWSHK